MRIIFKKFRTRMIVGCILAVIALLAVSVIVFINQPSFCRTPRGERLERVMKSPNYRDGGYDTHYAEIGNRFPNIDLAILENGQYDKEWSLIHLMPQYMAQTARDLKAKRVLTVHHSKYALAKHRWDEPLKNAEEMKNKDYLNVLIPEIGEVVTLEK